MNNKDNIEIEREKKVNLIFSSNYRFLLIILLLLKKIMSSYMEMIENENIKTQEQLAKLNGKKVNTEIISRFYLKIQIQNLL